MLQHRNNLKEEKTSLPSEQRYSSPIQETVLFPHDNVYSHSYQEALKRPVSVGSDFGFPPIYQQGNILHGSQETLKDVRDLAIEHKITSIREDSKENLDETLRTEQVTTQKLLNQMSSGYHTQPSDSRGENKISMNCKSFTSIFIQNLFLFFLKIQTNLSITKWPISLRRRPQRR